MASLSPAFQRDWVMRIASAGFIVGVALSWRAWTNIGRSLPTAPVFGWGQGFHPALSVALTIAMLLSFATIVVRPSIRSAGLAGCVFLLILALLDQMRWQPWVWHCLLLVAPFLLLRAAKTEMALRCARITTIGFYFWAGFHKIGAPFQNFYRGTLIRPWLAEASPSQESLLTAAGYAIPVVEIAVALLLALKFRLTRRAGVLLVTAIHLGILG